MFIRLFLVVFAILLPSISYSETSNGYSAFGSYLIGRDSGDIRNVDIFKTPQKSQVNPKDKIGTITFDQNYRGKYPPIIFSKEIPCNYQLLVSSYPLSETRLRLQVFSDNPKGNNDGWIKIGFIINDNKDDIKYAGYNAFNYDNNSIIYAWIKMQKGDKLTAYKDFYEGWRQSQKEELLVKFFVANINNKKLDDLSSENKKIVDELIKDSCWCFSMNVSRDVYEYTNNNLSLSGKRKKITSISLKKNQFGYDEHLNFDIIKTEGDKALIIFLDKEKRLIIGWINIFDNKHRYIIGENGTL
ncbi:MAG: hypothetical protein WCJ33_00475 [Pseudomonadota bacterium]